MVVEIGFVGLMVVSAVVAMAVRRLRLPYTIALVFAGLLLGALRPEGEHWEAFYSIHLEPEVLFAIFLPALLYEAAFHIDLGDLSANWKSIAILAVPGVLVGAGVCGLVTWVGLDTADVALSLVGALMFGALICATDPIAVIAMLGKLGVSKRLRTLLEGESLFNDGTAVVVFGAVAALAGAAHHGGDLISAAWIARLFIWEVGIGFVVGLSVGIAHFWLTSHIDDHLIEITLTTVAAFGSYLISDALHASGVIAVVTAGLMAGNFGKRHGMSPSTRVALISFWEYVTFVANSLVFLLIGLEIDLSRLWDHALIIVLAWVATVLGRAVTLLVAVPLLSRTRERMPTSWAVVIWWGGLHGALSMVLAMSLPISYAHRGLIIDLTFGTVLLSIVVQGLTVGPLVRLLKLASSLAEHRRFALLTAKFQAVGAALREIRSQRASHQLSSKVAEALEDDLEDKLIDLESERDTLRRQSRSIESAERRQTLEHLIIVQKDALHECYASGIIDEESMRELVGELDFELNALEESAHDEEE